MGLTPHKAQPLASGTSDRTLPFGTEEAKLLLSEERDLGNGLHVLIVDDDVHALERARKTLDDVGFTVSTTDIAENLESRIAMLAPDLVVVDVLMPGLSGEELSRLLRAHASDEHPRIVLLSPVPPNLLASLVDTRGALGIIHMKPGANLLEQLLAYTPALLEKQAPRGVQSARSVPVVSGTHRIGGEHAASDPSQLARTGGRRA